MGKKSKKDDEESKNLLLEIGWWAHLQAKDEALRDMKMYKEELARLWYYVDQQLSSKHTYLIFLNDVKNRIEAELYTDFAEPDKEVTISDDDEVIELFGQSSAKIPKKKKLIKK